MDGGGPALPARPGTDRAGGRRHAAHRQSDLYSEVAPRHLHAAVQAGLPYERAWYVGPDGALDVNWLLADFQRFFREHSEHWVQRFERYQEAGPQLLLQAHLQRVVNGGGVIEREYALGRGRTDLLIRWPQAGSRRSERPTPVADSETARAALLRHRLVAGRRRRPRLRAHRQLRRVDRVRRG